VSPLAYIIFTAFSSSVHVKIVVQVVTFVPVEAIDPVVALAHLPSYRLPDLSPSGQ
jgi:hypothetical protein